MVSIEEKIYYRTFVSLKLNKDTFSLKIFHFISDFHPLKQEKTRRKGGEKIPLFIPWKAKAKKEEEKT